MRSRLFSMAAKPQALAGHLSQLQLEPGGVADWDTARGCSAHPTAAQSHPTELSEAVGRQEGKQSREEGGTSQVHKCRRYLFTKAEEDTSHFYPPPHAPSAWKTRSSPAWLHTGPSQALRADPPAGKTKAAFPPKSICRLMMKDWRSPSCTAWM